MTSILAYAVWIAWANGPPETVTEVRAGPHPLPRGAVVGDHAYMFGGVMPGIVRKGKPYEQPGQPPWLELDSSRLRPPGIMPFGTSGVLRVALASGSPECFTIGPHSGELGWMGRPGPVPLRWRVAGGALHHVFYFPNTIQPPARGTLAPPDAYVRGMPLTAELLAACRLGPETAGVGGKTADSVP